MKYYRAKAVVTTISVFILSIFLTTLTSCGSPLKIQGYDCPEANQLRAGITLQCAGKTIQGVMIPADTPACSTSGETYCLASEAFKATDTSILLADNIKKDAQVLGVVGTLVPKIIGGNKRVCNADGDTGCIPIKPIVAVSTAGLADLIVKGEVAGGVKGTGVPKTPDSCFAIAQVGCLTSAETPALNQTRLAECLLSN
jgi:hypothetical protein